MAGTKKCEACDAEIGESEKVCPKCGVDFEELEDTLTSVEKANAILEKRRKAKEPPTPPAPPASEKKKSKLRGLGSVLRKASK